MLLKPAQSREPDARTTHAAPTSAPPIGTEDAIYGWTPTWAPLVTRFRWVLIPLWLLVNVLCFNGQWRIGLDSAQYRLLARSIASGEGYTIMGEPARQLYPGLPLMLAGLECLFGPDPLWPLGVMLLISAATGAFVYLLARRLFPIWAATLITAGVIFNHQFVQQAHELMTDMPFLLGVVIALWGWEAVRHRPRGRGAVALLLGLGLAALMRPTFWVLVVACVAWAAIVVIQGVVTRDAAKRRHAAIAGVILACSLGVVVLFALLDPRTRGLDITGGGYESQVMTQLEDSGSLLAELPAKLWEVIDVDLPHLFFAERVTGLNPIFTLALLGGVVLLGVRGDDPSRRRPIWVLTVAALFAATMLASSEPRYWMMVLPMLWGGWLLGIVKGARDWFTSPRARSTYAAVGLGIVLLTNAGHVAKFAVEQQQRPFLEHYKDGDYAGVIVLADALREHTAEDDVIIGPFAPVLAYMSDRVILGRFELGMTSTDDDIRRLKHVLDHDVDWMVFPHDPYARKDPELYRLVSRGWIYPANLGAEDSFRVGVFGKGDRRTEWYVAPPEVDELQLPPEWRVKLAPENLEATP